MEKLYNIFINVLRGSMKDATDLPIEMRPLVQIYINRNGHFYDDEMGLLEIVSNSLDNMEYYFIEVREENTEKLLLRSRILDECNFEKEQTKIITWYDFDRQKEHDIGISFQSKAECDLYWKAICRKLGVDLLHIDGRHKIEMPTPINFHKILPLLKEEEELIIHFLIHSDEFKKGLWETFQIFREQNNAEGFNNIKSFVQSLLKKSDTLVLKAFLEKGNFQHFLKIYEKDVHVDFYDIYRRSGEISTLIELSEDIKVNLEVVERIRFMRTAVIVPEKDKKLENLMDHLMIDIKIQVLRGFVRDQVVEQCAHNFMTKYESGLSQNQTSLLLQRTFNFYSEYFNLFIPSNNPNLKKKIITTILSSNFFEIAKIFFKHNNFRMLQLFSFLVTDPQSDFAQVYIEDMLKKKEQSLQEILGSSFMVSTNNDVVNETLSFFSSFYGYFERDPAKFDTFNLHFLPIVFKKCEANPMRIVELVLMYINQFNKFHKIAPYVVKHNLFEFLQMKLEKKELRKEEMVKIVNVIKSNIITFSRCFIDFRKHFWSVKSLNSFLTKQELSKKPKFDYSQLADHIISSKVFTFYLNFLKNNYQQNNVVNSVVLNCMKLMMGPLNFNPFMKAVRQYDFQLADKPLGHPTIKLIKKYQDYLKEVVIPKEGSEVDFETEKKRHEKLLESEEEENYLMDELDMERRMSKKESEVQNLTQYNRIQALENQLMKLKERMKKEREDETPPQSESHKKVHKEEKKGNAQQFVLTFEFEDGPDQ